MADITPFPVDLDAEAIFVDGNWYTRDDLAQRIKAMLDQGEFQVSRPSAALEQLTAALRSVKTLAFRAPADLADAVSLLAHHTGQTVGQVLREAVMVAVKSARLEVTARMAMPVPPQAYPEPVAAAAPPAPPARAASSANPATTPSRGLPPAPPQAETGPAVLAGPGALRSAGVTEEKPVELTNRKPVGDR